MTLDRPMYRVKRRLLGEPLTTERVGEEKLSNRTALGVLASDCISSSAYGSEKMLRVLVPVVGAAAFTMVMPVTGAILLVLLLLTVCYSDVVTIYTRAGGSYVVARENFGPNVAQVAAVALLVDYVVTVAVQVSAGTNALISLAHLVGNGWTGLDHLQLPVSVLVIVLLAYGNLRGVREAGRMFALPAYLFIAAMSLVFLVAAVRALTGELPHADLNAAGVVPLGTPDDGWLYGASLFIVLRSFANGGSSLTGLEAISNGISAFREPQGRNARRTLITMSCVLAFLVLGVSTLAHFTHAVPYVDGTPTVIAQEARLAFGSGPMGTIGLVFVQLATALVLYTGANTPFTGFPFLASFVAQDRFLPRVLTRRGHRLAFSNGIITLAALSLALLLVTGANVDKLVALYAIGVFTAFTMAGSGLTAYHLRRREPLRRVKITVNALAAAVSAAVVLIFAVTKFTEGAWLVVVVFPLGVWVLVRINREYRREAAALERRPVGADRPRSGTHGAQGEKAEVESLGVVGARVAAGSGPADRAPGQQAEVPTLYSPVEGKRAGRGSAFPRGLCLTGCHLGGGGGRGSGSGSQQHGADESSDELPPQSGNRNLHTVLQFIPVLGNVVPERTSGHQLFGTELSADGCLT
ncbi:APC family permease [Streptomyces cyaneofuscatus]|uniref:APC family permease n=1 Tax=Streptomyces cyaneofuscatus TaxID=66883 RepID=UPI00368373E4